MSNNNNAKAIVKVNVANGVDFRGTIYAPLVEVEVHDDVDLYGRVWALHANIHTGDTIYFDTWVEANGFGTLAMGAWRHRR